ncbi:hypothetical protein Maq22A_1p38570 (plasmid) [Methylobacterium aquaticum]|uniref:Uncharacterized protein n=1 Tax=Methylobacterium aquaticum TaxID=270351 RepID=A0A1Y0ZCJ0_9HYPH|nr:hypothetical protein Maq22A_1p38570 [Methylobacterium aquaticum]
MRPAHLAVSDDPGRCHEKKYAHLAAGYIAGRDG